MTEHRQCKFITRILFFAVLCIAGSLRLAASEMAAATYTLNQLSPTTWNYQFTVTDTGTTPIGTFWFSWLPGQGYMNTAPISAVAPTGWVVQTFNGTTAGDGFSERWVDNAGALMPGQSISGLSFVSATTPAEIAGASPFHGGIPELTSDVYMGAPLIGADAPLVPSVRSTAYGHVNQLRDPAVFAEDGQVYLLYAVAGESGIAIAEIWP